MTQKCLFSSEGESSDTVQRDEEAERSTFAGVID